MRVLVVLLLVAACADRPSRSECEAAGGVWDHSDYKPWLYSHCDMP